MQVDRPSGGFVQTKAMAWKRSKRNSRVTARQIARQRSKIHYFKRTYNLGTGTTNPLTNTLAALNFSVNDMPSYTEFTSLYDYYKVNRIKVRIIPFQTESNSTGTVNNAGNVPIAYVVDTSDSTPPVTFEELLEYNDHKITNLYNGVSCYFKPKFADATSAIRDGWVATSNPSLNWYGFKYAIPPTTNAMAFYTIITFYVSFKDPK